MGIKYNPEEEVAVFAAVKELKEATTEEVLEYLQEQKKMKIKKNLLIRYLRKWKAGKIIAGNYLNGKLLWKLADIPPWYYSGIMAICKGTDSIEMRDALDGLNERLKNEGRIIQPRGVWGNYHTFNMTFECLTPILGGRLSGEERRLIFPNNNGRLIIPSSWFIGMFRDNAALIDLPKSIAYHIAVGNGEFIKEPETEDIQLKVKTGLSTYEAVKQGSKFKVIVRFPFKGSKLKSKKQIQEWFKLMEEAPLRGLGANPKALGGRIRLLEMKA